MAADVYAIDHDRAQRELAQVASHHFGQLLARGRDESTTHGTLARAARSVTGRRCFDRPHVLARRDAEHHLLHGTRRQRIHRRELLPRVQSNLLAVDAAHARSTNTNAAAAKRQLSWPRAEAGARTARRTARFVRPRASHSARSSQRSRSRHATRREPRPSLRKRAEGRSCLGLRASSWQFFSLAVPFGQSTPILRSGPVERLPSNFNTARDATGSIAR